MHFAHDWCKQSRGKVDFNLPLIIQEKDAVKPYPHPGVVFWNGSGRGVLRKVEVKTGRVWNNQELTDYFVALHDKPMVFWQDSGCPTCTKLIQAGLDRPEDVSKEVQLVESLTLEVLQQPPSTWIDRLLPILELLPVGFYYLTLLDYYPTDGHGNFFWDAFHTLRCWNPYSWESMEELQHDMFRVPPPPCYLVPSQHPVCYSAESLSRARDRFAIHPGLALKLQDTSALLLDGHHRATAAALAGAIFPCLTILPMNDFWYRPRWMTPFRTSFDKSINIPRQLIAWNVQADRASQKILATEEYLQRADDERNWHAAMLEEFSSYNYPWELPVELGLPQVVAHYPMHYRLDREELAKRLECFQQLVLPSYIKYDDSKTMQGME